MITRIPALELIQHLVGSYYSEDRGIEFKIWKCGYGVAMQLSANSKVQLVGVVGASNQSIECYAQVGLPNIVRLEGQMQSEGGLVFQASEPPLSLTLTAPGSTLELHLMLSGLEKASYVVRRA